MTLKKQLTAGASDRVTLGETDDKRVTDLLNYLREWSDLEEREAPRPDFERFASAFGVETERLYMTLHPHAEFIRKAVDHRESRWSADTVELLRLLHRIYCGNTGAVVP